MAKRGNKQEEDANKNKEDTEKSKDTKNQTQIVIAIAGVIIAAIALIPAFGQWLSSRSPETSTPTVTQTNTMIVPTTTVLTDTPVPPTPTQPTTTPTPAGYYEDFSQGVKRLPIGTPVVSDKGKESRYLADGVYHWDIQTTDNHIFGTSINDLKIPNFEYEVDFQKVEMSNPKDDYGIRFRDGGSAIYIFYINNSGEYGLSKYLYQEDKYFAPIERTPYLLINPNGNNSLKVIAQGESIHLFINSNLVERVVDKSSLAGSFSLWTWLPSPSDSMKMEINHISIIQLSSSSSLDELPTSLSDVQTAEIQLANVDDKMTVWVNGEEATTALYGDVPTWVSIRDYLKSGDNLIEVRIWNGELGDCNGRLRLRLNGIVHSAYQRFWDWDSEKAPQNIECFHDRVTLTLK